MLPDFRSIALYICAVLMVVLGLATWHYRALAKTSALALQVQNAAVVATNTAAARLLDRRTKERDAKQAELDKRLAAREKTDEKAVVQIGADDKLQRAAPVRVRVLNCTRDTGSGGGGAAGGAATAAEAGVGDAISASGLLSKEGARRLADALKEVEIVGAAYSACRVDAFALRGLPVPE